jgi:alkylation response protein AidB-like acyl-CoA dehydrogenase
MTDLLYTDVEEDLRQSVREMLADRSPVAQVLARCEDGDAYDAALWRVLAAEMGLSGLAVPEEHGGAGASLREAAVVAEELGRGIAPVPYLGSAIVATVALRDVAEGAAEGGAEDGAEGAKGGAELLATLAGGTVTAALAVPFATAPAGVPPTVKAAGAALSGEVRGVADALRADTLLVPTDAGLFAVASDASGLTRSPVLSLDLTRPLCDLSFEATPGQLLASGPAADRAVSAALTAGAALLASEQLGIAEWCLERTVAYLKSRFQFGRPVGSFQALKHRLADVWVDVTQARAAARYAATCLADGDPDAPVAVALAQAHCAPAAVHAAEECVQLHGGIGFTWEHPAHLFLKRAKADAVAFGTPDRHRSALAELVDLPLAPI